MGNRVPLWARWGIVLTLAVPQLVVGLWAVLAPENWFESFPGFDPRLVAAEPPFNRHLASDAGAGFFATGLTLLVAAIWAHRVAVWTALLAYAAFTVPHVLYHLTHPSDLLSGAEDVGNVTALVGGLVLAAVFAWACVPQGGRTEPTAPAETARDAAEPLSAPR
jgi:hypothetical protein